MKRLPAKTLLELLQMYETVIAELRAMRDSEVERLIGRMTVHRDEVLAALAALEAA
jgi:hypothetical protein